MAPYIAPPSLPNRCKYLLNRLSTKLEAQGLSDVLDSFPPPTSFAFQDATTRHQNAFRLRLGFREQSDGSKATSWAYIMLSGYTELQPPVLIRDQVDGKNSKGALVKRSVTSLLRRAEELIPPFCFLQFDPYDDAKHVRDMLCALVLYYSLASGATTTAIEWSMFEDRLLQALEYIGKNVQYRNWKDQQADGLMTTSVGPAPRHAHALALSEDLTRQVESETTRNSNETQCNGGVVRSSGDSSSIMPGSSIARLFGRLGHCVSLLKSIPPVPVAFDRQSLLPGFFPCRMHFGTYQGCDVYVYRKQDASKSTKIMGHQHDGKPPLTWNFPDLTGLKLDEPFASIMRMDLSLHTRGIRIRYFVLYYHMLAENAGLIDICTNKVSLEAMIPALCCVCKFLKKAPTSQEFPEGIEETSNKTLIVRLQTRSSVLIALDRKISGTQSTEVADGNCGNEVSSSGTVDAEVPDSLSLHSGTYEGADQTSAIQPGRERESCHSTERNAPRSVVILRTARGTKRPSEGNFTGTEVCVTASSTAQPRINGSDSPIYSARSPTARLYAEKETEEAFLHTQSQPETESIPDTGDLSDVDLASQANGTANKRASGTSPRSVGGSHETQIQEPEDCNSAGPDFEHGLVPLRATPVPIPSSTAERNASDTSECEGGYLRESATPPTPKQIPCSIPLAIDFCSDNNDNDVIATANCAKRRLGATSSFEAAPHPIEMNVDNLSGDESRCTSGGTKKRKHTHIYVISDDEYDNNEVFEVDSDAWNRAFSSKSRDHDNDELFEVDSDAWNRAFSLKSQEAV